MGHGPPDGDGGGGGGGGRGTHPAPRGRMTAPGSPHPGMALATTQPLMMLPGALSSPLSSPLPLGAMPLAMPAPASAVVPHGPRETISPFGTYDFESASYVRSNPRLAYGGDGSGGAGSASGDHGARSPGVPRDGRLIHLHAPLPRHHAGTHHPGHGSMDDVLCGADGAPGGAHGGTEGLFDVRDAARRGRCITESPRCCPPSGQPDYLAYPDVGRHETSGLHVGHVERGAVAGMAERGLEREMSASGAPTARTSRHDVEEDEEENEEDDEMDEDEEARVLMETSKTLQALALETSYGRGRFASRR
ncbi:hypothetical protein CAUPRSCDRAFT_11281 [Caulochytrium protostelioides]|uniref:Uncharacterized protein n=1 Tax=Caulochytrium protostelioides TaxID=1555241 RepID=A0A4P9X068_9FUNG|nr:hypothetical protein CAUPRSCDRAFT_11281 [Caulochytrium protostelioides]